MDFSAHSSLYSLQQLTHSSPLIAGDGFFMNVDQQIQVLINQAPQYGVTSQEVSLIAPALKAFAQQLQHPEYFIPQTAEHGWLMTTLTHRTQNLTKNVVYAFSSVKDVSRSPHIPQDPRLLALPMPVAHILFQMLAMKPIDSIIFLETSDNLQAGTEISRNNLKDLIELIAQERRSPSEIPPNLA
jgi:hypothetical protein